MYFIIGLIFFGEKEKKGRPKCRRKKLLSCCRHKISGRANSLDVNATTTTTREDLRVSDPGASRSSRIVSLDFLRLEARALRKDALPRAVVLKCARFVVGFQREEKK